jgi:hypothetical protein
MNTDDYDITQWEGEGGYSPPCETSASINAPSYTKLSDALAGSFETLRRVGK